MTDENSGSSLLTQDAPATGGNPQGLNDMQRALDSAMDENDIPEWAPKQFWDRNARTVKAEDLGRSYKNLEKLLGTEKAPVPTNWDDSEQVERWYKAGGRPDRAEDYEFKRPTDLPKELPYDEDTEKSFRQWARENGLNKRQASNLYDAYVKTQIERHAAYHDGQKRARSDVEVRLRREYGDKYDAQVNLARLAISEFADPDYKQWLDESGAGNDPRMIRAWIKVGQKMTGDTKLKGQPKREANDGDMKRAIADYRTKWHDVLWNRDHPDHDLRVKELTKMGKALYGEDD